MIEDILIDTASRYVGNDISIDTVNPNVFYGQLYTNVCREHGVNLINLLLTCMALNVISRPDFIAYNKLDRDSFPVILVTKLYKAPRFVWTVKSPEEHEKAHSSNENAIFEK